MSREEEIERELSIFSNLTIVREQVEKLFVICTLQVGDLSMSWPNGAPPPEEFDEDESYDIDYLQVKQHRDSHGRVSSWWDPELVRIRRADQVFYDASICQAHGSQMHREVVDLLYGLIDFGPEYSKARVADFPNCGLVLGGCMPGSLGKTTRTWICDTCKANEKTWSDVDH